ncbi:9ba3deef-9e41-4504-ac60-73b8eb3082b4 [Sclerotinia trifoliorum]|uniref:9ba3deef-9e41-4504-ac60-73b8eb3082b4 n=1 Tax=Sclerotinia trifoliorum TaxID=28548 RepID=A0A8H2ZQK8_9HELO|nr:9ba3deef-9e41-4504-ac60-73b8eb3082b4 [Sclerotinia trifoliorum]
MSYLSGIDFRKKFAPLFEINPLLTNSEAYMILRENSFHVPSTCLDVAKKARKPRSEEQYWIPQKSLNQLAVTERLRGERITPISSPEDPQLTKSETTIDEELPDQETQKAKFPKVKPRETILLSDTDDEVESVIIVDERRQVSDNPDEDSADVKDQLEDADIPGSKRSFSVFEISDDSDADINDNDYGYDADSDPEIYHGSQSSSSQSVIRPLARSEVNQKVRSRIRNSYDAMDFEDCWYFIWQDPQASREEQE